MNWTIDSNLAGERLDQALVALDPSLSRGIWQKRIKDGEVFVNDKAVLRPHQTVPEGAQVRFEAREKKPTLPKTPANIPPLRIIEETADWIVLDKQPGLLVHPAHDSEEVTLIDSLLAHDPAIGKIGPEPERPGIIHRLDREVSGLMIVAKTAAAYDHLQQQFREHSIDKTYLALVHGVVAKDAGDIRFKLSRSTTKGRMAAHPENDTEGKVAWTHYTVVERTPGATLLHVNIFSGRTHQIRAHLFALGHPVIGDPLYVKKNTDRRHEAPRLMLQSIHLSFKDPASGETKTFDLEPVKQFSDLLNAWRIKE